MEILLHATIGSHLSKRVRAQDFINPVNFIVTDFDDNNKDLGTFNGLLFRIFDAEMAGFSCKDVFAATGRTGKDVLSAIEASSSAATFYSQGPDVLYINSLGTLPIRRNVLVPVYRCLKTVFGEYNTILSLNGRYPFFEDAHANAETIEL